MMMSRMGGIMGHISINVSVTPMCTIKVQYGIDCKFYESPCTRFREIVLNMLRANLSREQDKIKFKVEY